MNKSPYMKSHQQHQITMQPGCFYVNEASQESNFQQAKRVFLPQQSQSLEMPAIMVLTYLYHCRPH